MGSSLPFVSDANTVGQVWQEVAEDEMAFLNLSERQVREGVALKMNLAQAQAARIAEANGRIERAGVEGLGELVAQVPTDIYFGMMQLFGRGCWDDADFLASYRKHNPGCAARYRSRKTTVRVSHGGLGGHGDNAKHSTSNPMQPCGKVVLL